MKLRLFSGLAALLAACAPAAPLSLIHITEPTRRTPIS